MLNLFRVLKMKHSVFAVGQSSTESLYNYYPSKILNVMYCNTVNSLWPVVSWCTGFAFGLAEHSFVVPGAAPTCVVRGGHGSTGPRTAPAGARPATPVASFKRSLIIGRKYYTQLQLECRIVFFFGYDSASNRISPHWLLA
ncbi:hypothetical protein SFRURICE_017033 [Spodoptera frugiperda]|nr:hypothetical protein SFRURICE_017033 [Spodoptera frugiperda]